MDKVATVDPDDLEKEALAAAAEARSLAALSEVRIRFLGRQSALKLALREVRDRETGMTLNAVRETVESALSAREEQLARAELEERLATERVDVTLPARAARAAEAPAARHAPSVDARASRRGGHLPRSRLRDRRRPRGRDDPVQLRRSRLPRLASDPLAARHALSRRADRPPHRDVAGADPQDGGAAAADLHGLDRPRLPARHDRRDPLPDLPPVRGARHRQGHHAGRPQGNAPLRDARSCTAPSERCASARTTSRSPSRRWRGTSRASTAAARAARSASTRAGSSSAAPGWSTLTSTSSSAGAPRSTAASRSGSASSGRHSSATGSPASAPFWENDLRFLRQFR